MNELTSWMPAVLSGGVVGFVLGMIGGGGSILAVPLMVYVVGVGSPHVAIGTSALAVAANAAINLGVHARAHTVKWRCAGLFASAGVVGASAGSTLGKRIDGGSLLSIFAVAMIAVGAAMLRGRGDAGSPGAECNRENAPKVLGYGLGTGMVSGFFGIGGGFLIVPGLIASTGMPVLNAIGSSLVAITAFGLTTAFNYALSGMVDWGLATLFISGGMVGGVLGSRAASHLAVRGSTLRTVFAGVIFAVAGYILWRAFHVM